MKFQFILVFFIFLTVTAFDNFAQEFTLTTTAANLVASKAQIDSPGLSGNPQAIIVATPLGNTEKLNPHPIGAWYYSGKWNIFNTDHATMPEGLKFKVQVYLNPDTNKFLHIITKENLGDEGSYIDNPLLNNNSNAQFKILQNYAPDNRSPYYLNKFEAKAVYDEAKGKWFIVNVNNNQLNPNTAYNIVIYSESLTVSNTSNVIPTKSPVVAKTPNLPTTILSKTGINSSTQPETGCTQEAAYQTIGKWQRQGIDDLAMADKSFPKAEQKAVLTKAQKIIELLKLENPEFKGVEASAKRSIRGDSYFPNGALRFSVDSGYRSFFCVPNNTQYEIDTRGTIIPGGNSGATINFYFNDFGWALEGIEDQGQFLTSAGEALFYLPKQLENFKGMTVLQPNKILTAGKQEAIIITSNASLPYKPISREQFIQSRIKYYREFYQSQRRSSFEPEIAELNSFLAKMSPAERQTQAVVRDPFEKNDRLFVTEEKGGKRVVAIDKEFFDPKLPRSTIQFMIVYMHWDDKQPAVAEAIKQFKQNLDLESLKQMLGN